MHIHEIAELVERNMGVIFQDIETDDEGSYIIPLAHTSSLNTEDSTLSTLLDVKNSIGRSIHALSYLRTLLGRLDGVVALTPKINSSSYPQALKLSYHYHTFGPEFEINMGETPEDVPLENCTEVALGIFVSTLGNYVDKLSSSDVAITSKINQLNSETALQDFTFPAYSEVGLPE